MAGPDGTPHDRLSRRDLLASTVCVAATVALPSVAMGGQRKGQDLIDRAFEAQKAGRFADQETLLKQALKLGRTDEGVLRGLAFCLVRQWKFDEAISYAQQNHRQNPGSWSVAGLCETFSQSGRFEDARKWLQYAMDHKSEWGGAKAIFERVLDEVSYKTYQLTYDVDAARVSRLPNRDRFRKDIIVHVPMDNLAYQSSSYEVDPSVEYQEFMQAESRFLRVTPNGLARFQVRFKVKLSPMSVATRVQSFDEGDIPANVKRYLKASPRVESDDGEFRKLAGSLEGADRAATIENILRWIHGNLPWKGGPGDVDMETDSKLVGNGAKATLARGHGHCEAQTSVAVALLRAAGVPARFVRGHGGIAGLSGRATMHTWTEFFVPSVGWIQWDINNPPYTQPANICIACFRHSSPYGVSPFGAPGSGDAETWDPWFFYRLIDGAGAGSFVRTSASLFG